MGEVTCVPSPPPHPKLTHQGLPLGKPWQARGSERDLDRQVPSSFLPHPDRCGPRRGHGGKGSQSRGGAQVPKAEWPCATTRSCTWWIIFTPAFPPRSRSLEAKCGQVGRDGESRKSGTPAPPSPGCPTRGGDGGALPSPEKEADPVFGPDKAPRPRVALGQHT